MMQLFMQYQDLRLVFQMYPQFALRSKMLLFRFLDLKMDYI